MLRVAGTEGGGISRVAMLGTADPKTSTDHMLQVQLSGYGGSVLKLQTTRHAQTFGSKARYSLQSVLSVVDAKGQLISADYPLAAKWITIDGARVQLDDRAWKLARVYAGEKAVDVEKASWTGEGEAEFEKNRGDEIYTKAVYTLDIEDEDGNPIAHLERSYWVVEGKYELRVDQKIINKTADRILVVLSQNAIAEMPASVGDRSDSRKSYAGYFDKTLDPNRSHLYTAGGEFTHAQVIDPELAGFWPIPESKNDQELVWIGGTNRFFGLALFPTVEDEVKFRKQLRGLYRDYLKVGLRVNQVSLGGGEAENSDHPHFNQRGMFTLTTGELEIGKGETASLPLTLYAGPRDKRLLSESPYGLMELADKLVVYSMGCFCTFQFLTSFLYSFLRTLHDYVVFDWALAIILLVVVVRLFLHPITKKSQANMMKMGEQMKMLKPQIDKIKEKYKGDSTRIQQETSKLYQQHHVNPLNMLGCLPMFLQMPIWISLYAMLSFAFDLRHEAAFGGLFQSFGGWGFMADLSIPDHFVHIPLDKPLNLFLFQMENFTINILPLAWGVVMLISSKYTATPAADDQGAMQQKMQRYMLLLMPLMMYTTPSALTLYFLISSIAGTYDSYLVRKHIKEQKASGDLFKRKPVKPGGFRDKMGRYMQSKQEELAKRQGKNPDGAGANRNQYKARKKKR